MANVQQASSSDGEREKEVEPLLKGEAKEKATHKEIQEVKKKVAKARRHDSYPKLNIIKTLRKKECLYFLLLVTLFLEIRLKRKLNDG